MENNDIKIANLKPSKIDFIKKGSICLSDIPKEFIYEYEGKKYLPVDVKTFKQPDKYGNIAAITINTWKPEKKKEQSDDMPF